MGLLSTQYESEGGEAIGRAGTHVACRIAHVYGVQHVAVYQ